MSAQLSEFTSYPGGQRFVRSGPSASRPVKTITECLATSVCSQKGNVLRLSSERRNPVLESKSAQLKCTRKLEKRTIPRGELEYNPWRRCHGPLSGIRRLHPIRPIFRRVRHAPSSFDLKSLCFKLHGQLGGRKGKDELSSGV